MINFPLLTSTLLGTVMLIAASAMAHPAVPYKLCKSPDGVCTYRCDDIAGNNMPATCNLIHGRQCQPQMTTTLYNQVRDNVFIAMLGSSPDGGTDWELICQNRNQPKLRREETFDQRVHRLFPSQRVKKY